MDHYFLVRLLLFVVFFFRQCVCLGTHCAICQFSQTSHNCVLEFCIHNAVMPLDEEILLTIGSLFDDDILLTVVYIVVYVNLRLNVKVMSFTSNYVINSLTALWTQRTCLPCLTRLHVVIGIGQFLIVISGCSIPLPPILF